MPDKVINIILSSMDTNDVSMSDTEVQKSRTELDSHANMPVVGSECFIISDTGKTAEVHPYSPEYEVKIIPIVHAAVKYESKYTGIEYVLVIRNALYVPTMNNNLIPPFIMREAGIQVNDVPKCQMDDPTIKDHSLYFEETNFRIPLSLNGIFSYCSSSKPSKELMLDGEEVYILTPANYDPHSNVYRDNEL